MAGSLPEGDTPGGDGSLPAEIRVENSTPLSAYVHVPFCRVRCGYCDFNTYTADELRGERRDAYAETVKAEVDLAARVLAKAGPERALQTVFFGGGTPTLLPTTDLGSILQSLRETWGLVDDAEVTCEANPDTLDERAVAGLVEAGITRVSMGVQSTTPHVLQTLDRAHDPRRVPEVVDLVRAAGLDVSVDVIYGTPGESIEDWRHTLDDVVALELDHVSAYALIVEEGTSLERRIRRGDLRPVDDDLQADMYELADEVLGSAGLSWYEISNWARNAGSRSRHNLAYWSDFDWWGFGPGAHSHISGARFWNVRHPAAYAQRLRGGLSPVAGMESPDGPARELERVMLGIRVAEGVSLAGIDSAAVDDVVSRGLINDEAARSGRGILTLAGRLRADEVVRRLTAGR